MPCVDEAERRDDDADIDAECRLRERRRSRAARRAAAARAASERGALQRAVAHYAAGAALADGVDPELWSECVFGHGRCLEDLGTETGDARLLGESVALFRDVLLPRLSRSEDEWTWGTATAALAGALQGLGKLGKDASPIRDAVAAHREALEVRSLERWPEAHLRSRAGLAAALRSLAAFEPDRPTLEEAAAAYREALSAAEAYSTLLPRASVLRHAADVHRRLAVYDRARCREAAALLFLSLKQAVADGSDAHADAAVADLTHLLTEIAGLEEGDDRWAEGAAFLGLAEAAVLSDPEGKIYSRLEDMLAAAEPLRIDLGLVRRIEPPLVSPPPLPEGHDRPAPAHDDILEALDPARNGPRPPWVTGPARDARVALARSLAANAEAAWAREDYREEALFYGAAAVVLARVDEDERQGWLFRQGKALMRRGAVFTDVGALHEALRLYRRQLLPLLPRRERPRDWAEVMSDIGRTHYHLGAIETDDASLLAAVEAHAAALEVYVREAIPERWAALQSAMGAAYGRLARRDDRYIQPTLDASRAALTVETYEADPAGWARNWNCQAAMLTAVAERHDAIKLAEVAVGMLGQTREIVAGQGNPLELDELEGYRRRALAVIRRCRE